jgi:FkbM family methyltransferase
MQLMDLGSILRKTAGLAGSLTTPKQINGLSRYLYIRNIIRQFDIDIIFDVGANVGQFAHSMRDIGYRGKILSFEPVSKQFKILNEAASHDEKWQTLNIALGDEDGTSHINVMKEDVFSSFKSPSQNLAEQFSDQNVVVGVESVQVRRLDKIISEMGFQDNLHRCFLKCDTQGFDKKVLDGAGIFLKNIKSVMLEVSVVPIYENTPHMTDLILYLQTNSFSPVGFFPVTAFPDHTAVEFDYICINNRN